MPTVAAAFTTHKCKTTAGAAFPQAKINWNSWDTFLTIHNLPLFLLQFMVCGYPCTKANGM